jgi:hypothetical protein
MEYTPSAIQPGSKITLNVVEGGYATEVTGVVTEVRISRYLNMEELALEGSEIGYMAVEEVSIALAGLDGMIDVSGMNIRLIDETDEGE